MLDPKKIRKTILKMAYDGQSAHVACAFSIVEILCAIFDVKQEEDRIVLSKGHGVMALYACLYELGELDKIHLDNYLKDGSLLHGLAEPSIPSIDAATGSLGHGLPFAVGVALSNKRKQKKGRIFCIVGDGEMQEGSNWEALQFATQHELDNLTLIVDKNGYQAMGHTAHISDMVMLETRLESFGCITCVCNGHSPRRLKELLKYTWTYPLQPYALIAETEKGYGISFIANQNEWHYKRLTKEIYEKAVGELS